MLDYRIDFVSLPWETVMEGVRRKVVIHSRTDTERGFFRML